MRIEHHMTLQQDAWVHFAHSLAHPDLSIQRKANDYFAEIEQNLVVTREPNRISVHSHNLDEEAILAALLGDNQHDNVAGKPVETYNILINTFLNYNVISSFYDRTATEDCYHQILAEDNRRSSYSTANMVPCSAQAA